MVRIAGFLFALAIIADVLAQPVDAGNPTPDAQCAAYAERLGESAYAEIELNMVGCEVDDSISTAGTTPCAVKARSAYFDRHMRDGVFQVYMQFDDASGPKCSMAEDGDWYEK